MARPACRTAETQGWKTVNTEGVLKMAVPKRKTSKMKKRQRKAANRYEGVQANFCTNCSAPNVPHCVCPSCGTYGGKQVLAVGS